MGFLEVSVEMFKLSGMGDFYTQPGLLAWGFYLLAVLCLALTLKKPKKEDQIFKK